MNTPLLSSPDSSNHLASSAQRVIGFLIGIVLSVSILGLPALANANGLEEPESGTRRHHGDRKSHRHRWNRRHEHPSRYRFRWRHRKTWKKPPVTEPYDPPGDKDVQSAPELDANGLGAAMVLLLGSVLVISGGRKKAPFLASAAA